MVDNTLNFLLESKLIAVFRSSEPAISVDFAKACIDGGIKSIEVVLDSPESFNLISELCGLNDILIGAGTVLNVDDALRAIESGAKFIVSPHTDKDIISVARSNKTVVVSGAFTSSEIVVAWKLGAHLVKIFPASANGPNYIKALKEPLAVYASIRAG